MTLQKDHLDSTPVTSRKWSGEAPRRWAVDKVSAMGASFGCATMIHLETCRDPLGKTCDRKDALKSRAIGLMKLRLLAAFILCAAACGGTPRNTPLKNRVSEKHLAPISMADRGPEAEANQAVFLGQWQLAFTESQLKGAKLEIKIAKNNLSSAKLGKKSANLEKEAADDSGDINKIKAATQAALVADREAEVHKISIERAKQSLAYLKKRQDYEESKVRSLEAKLEYARAQSLKSAGILPPKFDVKTYKSQYSQRQSQTKSKKSAVDSEHKQLKSIDQRLAKAKSEVAVAKGTKSETATVAPVAPIPAVAPPPPKEKAPTPKESLPGDTKPAPEPKPASETKPPEPKAPEPAPSPSPESTPSSSTSNDSASTSGGQL